MTSKEFIYRELKSMNIAFPQIMFKYEYNDFSKSHLIKVFPADSFENSEYINQEKKTYINFISLFPFESICFFNTNDDLILSCPEIFAGLEYNVSDFEIRFEQLFGHYNAEFPSIILLDSLHRDKVEYSFETTEFNIFQTSSIENVNVNSIKTHFISNNSSIEQDNISDSRTTLAA